MMDSHLTASLIQGRVDEQFKKNKAGAVYLSEEVPLLEKDLFVTD